MHTHTQNPEKLKKIILFLGKKIAQKIKYTHTHASTHTYTSYEGRFFKILQQLPFLCLPTGLVTTVAVFVLSIDGLNTKSEAKALDWLFLIIFPNYCMTKSFMDIYTNYLTLGLCKKLRYTLTCPLMGGPCCKSYGRSLFLSFFLSLSLTHCPTFFLVFNIILCPLVCFRRKIGAANLNLQLFSFTVLCVYYCMFFSFPDQLFVVVFFVV